MTPRVGIMIEGQEGLTWDRWRRLARAVEAGGFDSLFRSDHLTGLFGESKRPSLDAWASLTWLATATTRIRFGPLVCPLTFYHPALLAKRAAAVDQLSGGRLDLGLGAGWHEPEHRMYGIPFPSVRERLDRLECGARLIRALGEGRPVTLDQPYYPLAAAESYPLPARGRLSLIIGGRGEKRTLRIVAEHADEWNTTRLTFDEYPAKRAVLEQHCRAVGRDPATLDRSLMVPVVVGGSSVETTRRLERARAIFPRLPEDAAGWRGAGFLCGSSEEVAGDLLRWRDLGVQRVMLQLIDMDDLDAIELIARDVLPALGADATGTITIRPVRAEECEAVLALWRRAGAIPSATDTLEELTRLVRGENGDGFLVAVRDGAVVGTVIGGWDGWRGNIYRLAVVPEARRRGTATALGRAAERVLWRKGARRMSALVDRHEAHAVAFWDARADDGYRRDERMMRYVKALTA